MFWFKKKQECKNGAVCAWKYDGKLFETEAARDKYIFEKKRQAVREDFIRVVEMTATRGMNMGKNFSPSLIRDCANLFFSNAYLFKQAIEVSTEKHFSKEKENENNSKIL